MKNIVVGIDFSQNSENALRHAVALALKTDAKIHIVWDTHGRGMSSFWASTA